MAELDDPERFGGGLSDPKRVFTAIDAAPVVLYGKRDANTDDAYPIIADSNGNLTIASGGIIIPSHDSEIIDQADENNITIKYYLSGALVGTQTITISGTRTTIAMT